MSVFGGQLFVFPGTVKVIAVLNGFAEWQVNTTMLAANHVCQGFPGGGLFIRCGFSRLQNFPDNQDSDGNDGKKENESYHLLGFIL